MTAPDVTPPEPTPLRCPHCGAELEFELTYTGHSYSEHRDLTGIECENFRCNARWTNRGEVERMPRALP
jgi:sarcosine oxidase delta subunit